MRHNHSTIPRARTSGIIAQEVGAKLEQVLYVLRTRPHIKPIAKAGRLRLYDDSAVRLVRHELIAISARRST